MDETDSKDPVRMLQISELDLSDLERLLPEIAEAAQSSRNSPRLRSICRKVKTIVSDVRWNYGPHDVVEEVE